MTASPSGTQYTIAYRVQRAIVTEVGATLRDYSVDGHSYIDGFDVDQRASDGRGQVLAPWPNRLAEGRYTFEGQAPQAALNEPSRGNAIHGLVRWLRWSAIAQEPSSLTLECGLPPQPGYEWSLLLRVTYGLSDAGLRVAATVLNTGHTAAPLGVGFHPYLRLSRPIDDLLLTLPSSSPLALGDPDVPPSVVGDPLSSEASWSKRRIGTTQLDTAFTDLQRGSDGTAVATLADPGGEAIDLWVDESFGLLMVYTGDQVGDLARRRQSIAIEPMTCPPNALRSGAELVVLQPDESWEGSWGLRATAAR